MNNSKNPVIRKIGLKILNFDNNGHEKKGKNGNGEKDTPPKVYPLVVCPRCKKKKRSRCHHGYPQWIFKRLKIFGFISQESENNQDKVRLCDDCHAEIEEINLRLEALLMEPHMEAVLKLKDRFLAGEVITNECIARAADESINSLIQNNRLEGQGYISLEEEIPAENI